MERPKLIITEDYQRNHIQAQGLVFSNHNSFSVDHSRNTEENDWKPIIDYYELWYILIMIGKIYQQLIACKIIKYLPYFEMLINVSQVFIWKVIESD